MTYVKKTYAEGSLVTPEDMNRIETGIAENENKINNCLYIETLQEIDILDYAYKVPLGQKRTFRVVGAINCPPNVMDAHYTILKLNDVNTWFTMFCKDIRSNNMYISSVTNNTWSGWEKIPNNEKIQFYCTASTGMIIKHQDCYTLNGKAYINVTINKSDGTPFETIQRELFSTPYYEKDKQIPITAFLRNVDTNLASPVTYNGAIWSNGICYIIISSTTIYGVTVQAEVNL